jgi:hypothetical protein
MSGRVALIRPALNGMALIVAALAVGQCGAVAAVAMPSAQRALPRLASGRVGPGWSIAEYSAASSPQAPHRFAGKTTLYLVSPTGRKVAFFSWPAAENGPDNYYLVDWSADGQRVLVRNFFNGFEQISVVTGKIISKFRLPAEAMAIGYTGPADQSILASDNYSQDSNTARIYNLAGQLTKILTRSGPPLGAIGSPGGAVAVVSTNSGIELVSNAGRLIKRLHPPVPVTGCAPRRWWNTGTVLASCDARRGPGIPRLWLFPADGRRATALTAQRSASGTDLGDIGAWKLPSGVYLQALSLKSCMQQFIATQSSTGSVHQVTIPGVPGDDRIITGQGSRLLVQALYDCGIGNAPLAWFNPHTEKVTWVFPPQKNFVGVESAVPYGQPLNANEPG